MPDPAAIVNLRHETAAVEEGHHVFLNGDGTAQVVSDRVPGTRYTVHAHALQNGSGLVHFECDHPRVLGFSGRTTVNRPGLTPCKHAALLARRLERERIIRLASDGTWRVAE